MIASDNSQQHAAPADHEAHVPGTPVPPRIAIARAIAQLMPGTGHRKLAPLFDNRVSWHTIRSWRRGKRGMPQWAVDMLAAKLQAPAAKLMADSELVSRTATGRGYDWRRTRR